MFIAEFREFSQLNLVRHISRRFYATHNRGLFCHDSIVCLVKGLGGTSPTSGISEPLCR